MSWAVETILATSILMALVLLLRAPVSRMFGARAAYALWLAPLARLILPTFPVQLKAEEAVVAAERVQAFVAEPVAAPVELTPILLAIWGTGALLFLLWHAIAYRRFVADAVARGSGVAFPAIKDAAVIRTEAVSGPAAAGLIVRRIFVPQDFSARFSPQEQRLALDHEALHHRRGDLWASAVALLFLAFHWFNPIAHLAHRAFRRDLEAACDATLMQIRGPEACPIYARTILRCAGEAMPHSSCALTPLGELKGRLEMLNLYHGRGRRLAGAAFATLLAGSGLVLAQPVAAQEDSSGKQTERVEIRRIVSEGKDGQDRLRSALPEDLREKIAKCDGEKFEADTSAPGPDGKARTRLFICTKPGTSKAETAAHLEKVLSRIEGTNDMPAENKAQVVARLKARIAELKAGG